MITRHAHGTVTFGFDEWADDEEIVYADALALALEDDDGDEELDDDDDER
jgi:hypothetical protein